MNENLNLVDILKNCPKGTKFYSPVYGKIEFIGIETFASNPDPITIKWFKDENTTYLEYLRADGTFRGLGECIIFPSEDQRDWSKWQRPLVDGDVVIYINRDNTKSMFIYKEVTLERKGYYSYCWFNEIYGVKAEAQYVGVLDNTVVRLATEEEKQKLFKALEDNGYKWNADTKKLKEIEPKFDVCTLRPFDKVLCRMNDDDIWGISLFERYIPTNPYPFFCIQDTYNQCIPYNDETIHLLGTTQQVSDKYINW